MEWLEVLATSTALVAVAEMGDKTQLLSFALAARLRQPRAIIAGILVATLANHALAASAGIGLAHYLSATAIRWIAGSAFIAFAAWALWPDTLNQPPKASRYGAFSATVVAFFLAEMGDKTQFATIALAARYDALVPVTFGTTLGMMIANIPAVLLGARLSQWRGLRHMRLVAAALFLVTGIVTLLA